MERELIRQKIEDLELESHGKTVFGLLLLVILVIGIFRPIALSGIPLLFGAVTFLGGTTILAGISGLLVALVVDVIYLSYHFSRPVRELFAEQGK